MVMTRAAGPKCLALLGGSRSERLDGDAPVQQQFPMRNLPNWTPPELPPDVATFDCIDFGNHCARGYNPNGIAGSISGVPIKHFSEGQWLSHLNTGSSGIIFVFRDASGRELGRAFKCSGFVAHDLFKKYGKLVLKFTPTRWPS